MSIEIESRVKIKQTILYFLIYSLGNISRNFQAQKTGTFKISCSQLVVITQPNINLDPVRIFLEFNLKQNEH
jgi:hypothetical protein